MSSSRRRIVRAVALTAVLLSGVAEPSLQAQTDRQVGDIHVVHVNGNVWMLVTPDGNLALQAGDQGALLVDTGRMGTSEDVLAAVRAVTDRPLRFIINTSAAPFRIGNNAAFREPGVAGLGDDALEIVAREAVLFRMVDEEYPADGWPTDAYIEPVRDFRFNGEVIDIVYQPTAYSNGDSIVYFRSSDVVVAGEIYDTERFPLVDREREGTVEGVLAGLNRIIDFAVPDLVEGQFAENGTLIIPGRGRLSDQDDVVEYRDMVHIVRDRLAFLTAEGRTLDEVRAERPLVDYEERFTMPTWTASMFLDALYAEFSR